MKIIGLTGGIGSGKSTVAGFLKQLGAAVIDADKIGHEALKRDDVRRRLTEAFGPDITGPDGEISRRKLGEIVFGDDAALKRLNEITHPVMAEIAREKLEDYRRQGLKVAVIDAPLLIEAGWHKLVDEVWVTIAPDKVILERLRSRDGMNMKDALARIRTQLAPEDRARHADAIIDTRCQLDELEAAVAELWQNIED